MKPHIAHDIGGPSRLADVPELRQIMRQRFFDQNGRTRFHYPAGECDMRIGGVATTAPSGDQPSARSRESKTGSTSSALADSRACADPSQTATSPRARAFAACTRPMEPYPTTRIFMHPACRRRTKRAPDRPPYRYPLIASHPSHGRADPDRKSFAPCETPLQRRHRCCRYRRPALRYRLLGGLRVPAHRTERSPSLSFQRLMRRKRIRSHSHGEFAAFRFDEIHRRAYVVGTRSGAVA